MRRNASSASAAWAPTDSLAAGAEGFLVGDRRRTFFTKNVTNQMWHSRTPEDSTLTTADTISATEAGIQRVGQAGQPASRDCPWYGASQRQPSFHR